MKESSSFLKFTPVPTGEQGEAAWTIGAWNTTPSSATSLEILKTRRSHAAICRMNAGRHGTEKAVPPAVSVLQPDPARVPDASSTPLVTPSCVEVGEANSPDGQPQTRARPTKTSSKPQLLHVRQVKEQIEVNEWSVSPRFGMFGIVFLNQVHPSNQY